MSESSDADNKTPPGSPSEFNRHQWVRIPLPAPRDLDEFIEDFFEDDKDSLRKYKHAKGR
jgi:hypothetical protein